MPQIDDPDIHPMTRPHQDFRALPPKLGKDDLIEYFRRHLSDRRQLRFHEFLPRRFVRKNSTIP
jgi:hypothetical protein